MHVLKMLPVDIIHLHAMIVKQINTEEKINKDKVAFIQGLLNHGQQHLEESIYHDLDKLKQTIEQDIHGQHIIFLCKSKLLIDEYETILKKQLDVKDALIQHKKQITNNYLDLAREFIKYKQWTHITIPISTIQPTIACTKCQNTNDDYFDFDDYNRKTCLLCSHQQCTIENGPVYRDYNRSNVVGKFVYNRIVHFQDCIKQYQGKQNCKIPDYIYRDLNKKFNAYRLLIHDINDTTVKYSQITRQHILTFLKELKYTKHYENVNLIYYMLTHKRIDDISDLEAQLLEDFKNLVVIYDEVHGKDKELELKRKNFMNVQYILFQLLRRHNHPCKIENFTVLKTTDRKHFHDHICSNLFEKLGWKFTPIF